jgi:hypothetical protein
MFEKNRSRASPYTQQDVDRELIEPLVRQTFFEDRIFIKSMREQLERVLLRILTQLGNTVSTA